MTMPKIIPIAMRDKDTIRKWKLIETWLYELGEIKIVIPQDFIFDGASIPRIFRRLYSPTGYLFLAALVHDFCYDRGYYNAMRKTRPGRVVVSRKQADNMFKAIAKVEYPNHIIKTTVAYWMLRIGGWVAWNKHRNTKK